MTEDRTKLSDAGEAREAGDPQPSELEIDYANDSMGGPTTESLHAGLSTAQQSTADGSHDEPAGGNRASEGGRSAGSAGTIGTRSPTDVVASHLQDRTDHRKERRG